MAGTSKKTGDPYKEFIKLFESLAHRYYRTEVFSDFLDYSLAYFRHGASAQDFKPFEAKWNKPGEIDKLQQLFFLYGEMADHNGVGFHDPLGDLFMEIISKSSAQYRGQFFTPTEICNMIAQMNYGDGIKEWSRLSDPACGSGRTLLAMAKLQRKLLIYAADVDQLCCKMSLLNFLSNSLTAEVAWMNSLSFEHFKTWHCGTYLMENGMQRPYWIEVPAEQTYQLAMWEEKKMEKEAESQTDEGNNIGKHNQIELF